MICSLVIGVVAGCVWAIDRQLRGGLLAQRAEASQRPDWVALESLPAHVPGAFLTVVDPDFVERVPVRSRDDGKTIPRELVRQIHLLTDGLGGEARERVMAPVLEQRLGRRDVLEMYLNRVYVGQLHGYPIYGVHHAAVEYFGKESAQMTLSEAATLAALLLEPRIEQPAERSGAVGVRRNEVLRMMLQNGAISQEDYRAAIAERLAFQPGLTVQPMSRRILLGEDTAVIRLPPEYRPRPEEQDLD
ncbi:MAG TPA: transglycosylase domain-containing protein [Longimicrobiaceae bacterium]|nr:transglycosylase domain-containing protein [Longimicrobiaceae bacterium]